MVYATSARQVVWALNAATGASLRSLSTGITPQSGPVAANGLLYVGTGDGGVQAFGVG